MRLAHLNLNENQLLLLIALLAKDGWKKEFTNDEVQDMEVIKAMLCEEFTQNYTFVINS